MPTPTPADPLAPVLVPLAAIDDAALPRDRTGLDAEALAELRLSIAASGLRMPIEVWPLSAPTGAPDGATPRGDHRYGLISGLRRLQAFRDLYATAADKTPFEAIPAFVRAPASYAAALAAMVEENAVRADLSPWEQAKVAVTARDCGAFATIEEAVDTLYANFSGAKRKRLRALSHLAEELDGDLTAPETLSLRQLLRLAAAVTRGFGDVIRHALGESRRADAAGQWQILLPILVEAEAAEPAEPQPTLAHRPGRPRRLLTPRCGVNIRREKTPDGYCLHFTGRLVDSDLVDLVFDEIERMFGPA